MTQTYLSVVTTVGQALLAAALAAGTTVALTTMKVGDGNGAATTPNVAQTQLVNTVYSAAVTSLSVVPGQPNWMQAELVIPAEAGGWFVREVGLFAGANLFAVANFPETYKPVIGEGTARELTVRLVFQIASTALVSVNVDPSAVVLTQAAALALIQSNSARVFAGTGGPNVWNGVLTPIPNALVDGMEFVGAFGAVNTAAAPATLNLAGLGAKPLVLEDGSALPPGELPATAKLVYRAAGGGKFVVANPSRGAGFASVKSVASAATVDLGAQGSHLIKVTGATTITAFGASAQAAAPLYVVTFAAGLTLTHNATSLALPRSADIVTAADDTALMLYLGSGNWRCLTYSRADGSALTGLTADDIDTSAGDLSNFANFI